MLNKFLRPHAFIVTVLIFAFIQLLQLIPLDLHFLDPFNNSQSEYEVTDIVYSRLTDASAYTESNIVIINSGKPDRKQIATLIDKLVAADARVIGVDILFEEFAGTPEDSMLLRSIEAAPQIVLACEVNPADEDPETGIGSVKGVHPNFRKNAEIGFVNFPSNSAKTIRVFRYEEVFGDQIVLAFATAVTSRFSPEAVERLQHRRNEVEEINYLGDKDYFALQEINFVLDSLTSQELSYIVKDKIVLVGYTAGDPWLNPMVDKLYTPLNPAYSGKALPDMYGVVIHANVISMLLNNRYIDTIPGWMTFLFSFLFCYLNVILIYWIYYNFHEAFHIVTRFLQIGECLILFLLVALLFYFFQIKLQFAVAILALLLAYDIIEVYETWIRDKLPILDKIPEKLFVKKKKAPAEGSK